MLTSGALRHRVTVRAPAGVLAAGPVVVASRISAAIGSAAMAPEGERVAGGGVQSTSTATITLRFRSDIRAAYEVVEHCCLQRTFQILSLEPNDVRDALVLTCAAVG